MSTVAASEEIGTWLENLIGDFVARSPENTLGDGWKEKAWDPPLVGFSNGADPLYREFKVHVGPFHYFPEEIFSLTFPEEKVKAADLTIVCWVLPQRRRTKLDNRKERSLPSERWSRVRFKGERFNDLLRAHVVEELGQAGIPAVAPILSPHWSREPVSRFGVSSRWSERHAAYASGLGTFGLCDGLITSVGKAHRLGTVVAKVRVPPTPRPYDRPYAYCLHYNGYACKRCAKRCPADAISEAGHDKALCQSYLTGTCMPYAKEHYATDGASGCGLCQTGTPCESGIPKPLRG